MVNQLTSPDQIHPSWGFTPKQLEVIRRITRVQGFEHIGLSEMQKETIPPRKAGPSYIMYVGHLPGGQDQG
jgi:hypothetical protein